MRPQAHRAQQSPTHTLGGQVQSPVQATVSWSPAGQRPDTCEEAACPWASLDLSVLSKNRCI